MPRLTDDAFGRIRRVFLTIPGYAAEALAPSFRALVAALPRDVRVDVLAEEDWVAPICDRFEGRGAVWIHVAPPGLDFTHWAQDAVASVDGERLMQSRLFDRLDDAAAARALAEAVGLSLDLTDAPHDGGDVLAMGQQVLVGTGTLDTSRTVLAIRTRAPRPAEETIAAPYLPEGWVETRRTGVDADAFQPLYHLDLFIAPAGTSPSGAPRWMVGCPRLGAEILGLEVLDHADADRFDEVAAQLRASGAEVLRNPQPMIWSDHVPTRHRTWLHLPTNNVLVQIVGADAQVWLPCFASDGWPELAAVDDANAEVWARLGFTVHRVAGCFPLAERRGALRCMCNVVARDPA